MTSAKCDYVIDYIYADSNEIFSMPSHTSRSSTPPLSPSKQHSNGQTDVGCIGCKTLFLEATLQVSQGSCRCKESAVAQERQRTLLYTCTAQSNDLTYGCRKQAHCFIFCLSVGVNDFRISCLSYHSHISHNEFELFVWLIHRFSEWFKSESH